MRILLAALLIFPLGIASAGGGTITPLPEPGSLGLLGIGVVAAIVVALRKRRDR